MTRSASDYQQLKAFFLNYLQFYSRTKRILGLTVFTLTIAAITLGIFLSGQISKSLTAEDLAEAYMRNVTAITFVVSAFLGGDALSQDLSSKTALIVLTQPIRRRTALAGRFLAAFLTSAVIEGVYYLSGILGGLLPLYQSVPGSMLLSFIVSIPIIASILGVSFLFSSIFKNGSTAIVATVLIIFVGFYGIQTALEQAGIEPWFLLTYGSTIINNIIPATYPEHRILSVSGGFVRTYNPYFWEGLAIVLAYLGTAVPIASLIYTKREIK